MSILHLAQNSIGRRSKTYVAILFLFPSILLFTYILIIPILQTIYMSLVNWNGISTMDFIGIDNYKYLLIKDRNFYKVLGNTVLAPILCNVIQIPIASILAFLVYRTKKGFRFFQSIYFIPVILSTAIMGLMFSLFFNSEVGPINKVLQYIGISNPPIWLSNSKIVLYTVLAPAIWQYIGYFFVIILAGMQDTSESVIECAMIDGASATRIYFHIMMPMIKNVIKICIVLNTIGALKSFDLSFIMTSGGPGASSMFLSVYLYKLAMTQQLYGRASAVATVLLLISLLFTIAINRLSTIGEDK